MPRLSQKERRAQQKARSERRQADAFAEHSSKVQSVGLSTESSAPRDRTADGTAVPADNKPSRTRKTPSSSIAERHALHLRAIQAIFRDERATFGPIVWRFLQDPNVLIIMSHDRHELIQSRAISLQTGWQLGEDQSMVMTSLIHALYVHLSRGPGFMAYDGCREDDLEHELDKVGALFWFSRSYEHNSTRKHIVLPMCHDSPGHIASWHDTSVSTGFKKFHADGDGWIAVASICNGWLARAWLVGRCEVYDITTGELLGSIKSIGADDVVCVRHLVMIAHGDTLLITADLYEPFEAQQKIDIVKVIRTSGIQHQAEIVLVSRTELAHKLTYVNGRFPGVAMNDDMCAFTCDELPNYWVGNPATVALYSLSKSGLSASPHAIVRTRRRLFYDVVLTSSKLITLEKIMPRQGALLGNESKFEVVVRDAFSPLASPLLVVKECWGGLPNANICCDADLHERFEIFYKFLEYLKDKSDTTVSYDGVIQSIEHSEPAALRDEEILASHANVAWVEHVEQRIQESTGDPRQAAIVEPDMSLSSDLAAPRERIHLLRFGSPRCGADSSENFRAVMLRGPELQPCRDALTSAGFEYVLPEEALMVVKPEQYREVRNALSRIELHPFHIVITETLEYLLAEILMQFPFKRRPRVKPGDRGRTLLSLEALSEVPPESAELSSANIFYQDQHADNRNHEKFDALQDFINSRTFICEAPLLRAARSVVQSTTEVVACESVTHYGQFRGINPRRSQEQFSGSSADAWDELEICDEGAHVRCLRPLEE